MKPRRQLILLIPMFCLSLLARPASGQELNCTVSINYQNISGNDYSFLDELGTNIREYINDRRWTEDQYQDFERITCSFLIVITEATTPTQFKARVVVASRRPIYGTVQKTTVSQFNDQEWQFEYNRGTPLFFRPDVYEPITSLINFYAYILLGFDYDSFDDMGGSPHFEQARRIADIASNTGAIGWTSLSGAAGRRDLITQIGDPRFRDLRVAYADYHLRGLDRFVTDSDAAQRTMLDVIIRLEAVADEVQRAYYLDQFFTAKSKEIASAFKGSTMASQAYDTLARLDPSHLSDYSVMLE
jgi:hypothetical protein